MGRIVAAAAVGGSAGPSDRWSDLDLSFGVAEGAPVASVLDDWTEALSAEFDAVTLFDLPFLSSIYRVFLLPGNLQVDLSFTPAPEFGAIGPRFELLFGEAVARPSISQPATEHIFGLGVHHAVRGYVCIERGRLWQAEYWIHELLVTRRWRWHAAAAAWRSTTGGDSTSFRRTCATRSPAHWSAT